ncbi:MAG: dihydrofolate synthase / folylpolyglutamate synthase [Solirubrobacteraceae bacterium]|nr:dihydrofolate synthase / folylpolyglutamate synthase [Solirubrobacteraceae bacterium]
MTGAGLDVGAGRTQRAQDAERWLLSLELFGMRFGLDRMRRLMTALDAPQEQFAAIHVVGTNGKSSTVRMIAALLAHHGIRTGAYLSPHLVSFAERIRIDGADISPEAFAAAVGRARRATRLVDRTLDAGDRVTQFEALTAAAYAQLADAGVEVAVVEAGLGGRWDATNVIDAAIVVLTNVGLEHTRWLGPTVADIAREKLAVVAPGATLVLGSELHPDAEAEALVVAERQGATIVRAPAAPPAGTKLVARGAFQRRNFAVACAAAEAWLGRLDGGAVRAAAASTVVPGRFEVLARGGHAGGADDGVDVVLDGAHNAGGIEALAGSLSEFLAGRPLVAVVSVLDDKDAAAMLSTLLPLCAGAVFTANNNPRALSPATLASLAGQIVGGGWDGVTRVEADPHRAVALARRLAAELGDAAAAAGAGGTPGGVVLATGSIYLVADLVRPAGAGRGSTL